MTVRPGQIRPPIVEPGELGPSPTITFPRGTWPEDCPTDTRTRWIVARVGIVTGYCRDILWFERSVDVYDRPELVPIRAFGIWPVGEPCPGTLNDCEKYRCEAFGACRRPT